MHESVCKFELAHNCFLNCPVRSEAIIRGEDGSSEVAGGLPESILRSCCGQAFAWVDFEVCTTGALFHDGNIRAVAILFPASFPACLSSVRRVLRFGS